MYVQLNQFTAGYFKENSLKIHTKVMQMQRQLKVRKLKIILFRGKKNFNELKIVAIKFHFLKIKV